MINNPDMYPQITAELIESLNEEGAEENISTGWHVMEFLLWGQDMNEVGPGSRPVSDYTTADNAGRRGIYLATASGLLRAATGTVAQMDNTGLSGNGRAPVRVEVFRGLTCHMIHEASGLAPKPRKTSGRTSARQHARADTRTDRMANPWPWRPQSRPMTGALRGHVKAD